MFGTVCDFSHARPIMLSIPLVYIVIYTCIYIYMRVVLRALNVLRASFSPIFQYFSAVNALMLHARACATELYCRPCTLNSSAMDSSAMDSSAIGVGVAVLVGKYMQGPWSAVPDVRSIR